MLDHAAKPRIAEGGVGAVVVGPRRARRARATSRRSCRASSPRRRGTGWRESGIERYAARLLEAFGPERVMWGSDWPVCTLAATLRGRAGARPGRDRGARRGRARRGARRDRRPGLRPLARLGAGVTPRRARSEDRVAVEPVQAHLHASVAHLVRRPARPPGRA